MSSLRSWPPSPRIRICSWTIGPPLCGWRTACNRAHPSVGQDFLLGRNHPEVRQCDSTLEVTNGAARFNADNGSLVGLPERTFGRPFHAFRMPIKASVGLEERFDKMHAYIADMEAARREAPADIEWPELDGHYGIPVLDVPLGSLGYVHAYMRGKVEAFAEAVDATVLEAVERVLGVFFDPSTYRTDTNPVITDFMAALLHDPDPMAVEAATLSEDAVARARSRLHLPIRLKGAGIRRMATVRDAPFIGCTNDILPSYAAALREAWGRLQAATAGHLSDVDARVIEREAEAASGSQKELTAFIYHANNSRLHNEVYTVVPRATAVDRFERSMLGDIQRGLAIRDAAWHNTELGQKGSLRDIMDMSEYTGMVD
eukprot:jgi/Tetstr1/439975/TSEL_003041.t1